MEVGGAATFGLVGFPREVVQKMHIRIHSSVELHAEDYWSMH